MPALAGTLRLSEKHWHIGSADATPALTSEFAQWQLIRKAYIQRQWPQALALLRAVQDKVDNNVLYQLYEQRLALLVAQPPGPEWDGTEHFQTK